MSMHHEFKMIAEEHKEENVKVIPLLDVPLIVDLADIHDPENGTLLSKTEKELMRRAMKIFPKERIGRFTRTELGNAMHQIDPN